MNFYGSVNLYQIFQYAFNFFVKWCCGQNCLCDGKMLQQMNSIQLQYNEDIDWKMKFKEISNCSDSISQIFDDNLELYIYLTEIFFSTSDMKLIFIIHKILYVLVSHNEGYFFQIDQFKNGSIPQNLLAYFVYLLLFSNLNLEENQDKVTNILYSIDSQPFILKKYFVKIIDNQISFDEYLFFTMLNKKNITIIYQICTDIFYSYRSKSVEIVSGYISTNSI